MDTYITFQINAKAGHRLASLYLNTCLPHQLGIYEQLIVDGAAWKVKVNRATYDLINKMWKAQLEPYTPNDMDDAHDVIAELIEAGWQHSSDVYQTATWE